MSQPKDNIKPNDDFVPSLFGITIYLDKEVERGVLEPDETEKWAYKVHPITWKKIKKAFKEKEI